jgi:hypothetical protein
VEGFVVDVEGEWEGGETEVGRAEEEDEEGSFGGYVSLVSRDGGEEPGWIVGRRGLPAKGSRMRMVLWLWWVDWDGL